MCFLGHLSEKLDFEGTNIYYYNMIDWWIIDYQLVITKKVIKKAALSV